MTSRSRSRCRTVLAVLCAIVGGTLLMGQMQMPDPKQISGVPLPAADVPAGTVSVRVIRGDFSNNVSGQPVEFLVDGKTRTAKTDEGGRAVVEGLAPGAHVTAATVLDGTRITSQEITIGSSGIRVVLVGVDPGAAARDADRRRLAAGPAVKGLVVLGPESRVIAELANERLTIYYVLQIVNSARTPVDIGGPLIFNLPPEAQGPALLDPAPPNATVNGSRVTVTGPFAPGETTLQVAYGLKLGDGAVTLAQTFPATLEQLTVLVPKVGPIDITSPQLPTKRNITDQGQPLILATGPGIPAGGTLSLEIVGLPRRPVWPRDLALTLAGLIMATGIWAAVVPVPRRRAA
jgi:hypothetical protein